MAQERLSLTKLIGLPLASLIEAESLAANETKNFLQSFGFTGDSENKWGELRNITFTYHKENANGELIEHEVEIPILTLIPIPLIQIERVSLDMSIRIDSTEKGRIMGFYDNPDSANDKGKGTPRLNLKIEVKQSDLPSGVLGLIRKLEFAGAEKVTKIAKK